MNLNARLHVKIISLYIKDILSIRNTFSWISNGYPSEKIVINEMYESCLVLSFQSKLLKIKSAYF